MNRAEAYAVIKIIAGYTMMFVAALVAAYAAKEAGWPFWASVPAGAMAGALVALVWPWPKRPEVGK